MTIQNQVPQHAQVLVIGGGPAGSYCAGVLAREGFSTVILEAARFPRYHIGESLLPSIRPFLKFFGAEDKVANHGFCQKPGAAVKFHQYKREGYTDFIALSTKDGAWNVVRSEFDHILLRHASELGAKVFEEHRVTKIHFTDGPVETARPTAVVYIRPDGSEGRITFDYLVDASGRAGIMATKYLKIRKMNQSLRNMARWGYWTGAKRYKIGTKRENAPWFEALTDGSGWAWFIPLHSNRVSVGVVMDAAADSAKKIADREASPNPDQYSSQDHYMSQLKLAPGVQDLLVGAEFQCDDEKTAIRTASDFSYAAERYSGDHFRLIGDASAFIDPFFSSGVHLALFGGLSAATTIAASIRKDCSEAEAAKFHDTKVAIAYTRFLLVVMSVYKQIRSQELPILADVDEDNFDRAFDILRPVIQGSADVGKTLSEDELQKTMDFCKHVFAPTDPSMHQAVGARLGPDLCSPSAPIMSEEEVEKLAIDDASKVVLKEINARKAIHMVYSGPGHLATEQADGFVARLEKGSLGLSSAPQSCEV